jgi:CRAL/TRIO domain
MGNITSCGITNCTDCSTHNAKQVIINKVNDNDKVIFTLEDTTPTSSSSVAGLSVSTTRSGVRTMVSTPEILGIPTVTNEQRTSLTTTNTNEPKMNMKSSHKLAGLWVDVDRTHDEPLPYVSPHDKRPSTRDLIEKHRPMIDTFQELISKDPLYDPVKHDDLWLLRYILSHKTVESALPAAKHFLKYRHELKLDEKDIRREPPSVSNPTTSKYFQCLRSDAMIFSQPDMNRGVVLFIEVAGIDQGKLAKLLDTDWPFWYFLEWMFQCLDSVTRRTGRLTKGIRIMDFQNFSVSQNNSHTINRNAQNARDCQDHYPQMLASVFVVNSPSVLSLCFRMIKPLLPRRFVQKFDILPAAQIGKLLPHMSEEHVPKKYGGKNKRWPPKVKEKIEWQTTIELVKGSSRLVEV